MDILKDLDLSQVLGGGCPKDREEFKGNKSAYCTFYKKYLADLLPYYVK